MLICRQCRSDIQKGYARCQRCNRDGWNLLRWDSMMSHLKVVVFAVAVILLILLAKVLSRGLDKIIDAVLGS